jgi:hypothetical protein
VTVPPRSPSVEAIAAQLLVHERPRPVSTGDEELTFADVLAQRDPDLQAETLYAFVLDRRTDEASAAGDALRHGLHPAVLGMDLLTSQEGTELDAGRRRRVARVLLPHVVRYRLGLPQEVPAFRVLVEPDAAFVLAAHRVALGVPATRTQYDDSVRLVADGHGREHLLRLLWQDPRARHRLFGPRRTRLGMLSVLQRRRSLEVFRAHVLAEVSATRSVMGWLAEWEVLALDSVSSLDEVAGSDQDHVLARLAEVASALRRLSGHTEW